MANFSIKNGHHASALPRFSEMFSQTPNAQVCVGTSVSKVKKMQFGVPKEIREVESHLTWMEEVIPYMERSILDKFDTLEEHITDMRQTSTDHEVGVEDTADDVFEEEYNDENPKYCSIYACRLNEAAKLAYCGEFKEALEGLELLKRTYWRLERCHRPAFKYCVDAMTWSIHVMMNLDLVQEDELFQVTEGDEVLDQEVLQQRWRKLQPKRRCRAVLRYLWGCLGESLKMSEDFLLDLFKEVLSLEPEYHIWYAEVYRKMRGIRRNVRRLENGALEGPCEDEKRMCIEAYERQPKIFLSLKDMGVMLKESIWNNKSQEYWDENKETYMRCKQYFEEALNIAVSRGQQKWTRKIQVYLAEFLLLGRGSLLNQEEGKRLFDQCLEENPEDSTVLHKVGKLCHYGAAMKAPENVRKYRDPNLAKELYVMSLEADPANYPCLKDYLKLLSNSQSQQNSLRTYVDTCDAMLDYMKRDYQVSDIKILRGCVIWIYNPFGRVTHKEDACESWIYVMEKLPAYAKKLRAIVRKPPFNVGKKRYPASINIPDLTRVLRKIRRNASNETLHAIQELIHIINH